MMPNMIDKSNALAWLESARVDYGINGVVLNPAIENYCKLLAQYGSKEQVSVEAMIHCFGDMDANCKWVIVDRTKERQSTKSAGVYILRNNELVRCTPLISALFGQDRNGNVKVNYMYLIGQFLELICGVEVRHV